MTSEATTPGASGVDLDALTDLRTPWCVHTVATLGIAGHIAAGIVEIHDLSTAAGCDTRALYALLAHLVSKGVFEEPEPGRFALNEAGRQLQGARFLNMDGIGGRMARAWSTLPEYVRTGRPAYAAQFGLPFWEDLARHPDVAADFDALMGLAGHGTPDAAFEVLGGWAAVRTVVDVGGGTGAMLAEILRARPRVRGTLVDLPGTVARATATFAAAGVADRVDAVGQSFFDPLPAGADLYLLRKVLNDWPDAETEAILRRCAEAARPSGQVVVMGGVRADAARPGLEIEMLLVGGRSDTLDEFRQRARRAGLEVVAAGPQASGAFAVHCRPLTDPGS
jgi:SAM-dependent methyltransferase